MYDYGLSVMEQYGISVTGSYRGRGALICKSQDGIFALRPFDGSVIRLEKQQQILLMLKEQYGMFVDAVLPTLEGELIARDQDDIAYVLRFWYEGRECDTRSREDIMEGAKMLGQLHRVMLLAPAENYVAESLEQEFQRHNRELRKIQKFIQKRHASNDFERLYLQSVEKFLEWGREAVAMLKDSAYEQLREEALKLGCACHGEYNQHHVIMGEKHAIMGFDKWRYDLQISDLYCFMRKILEKYNWDAVLGRKMLKAYETTRSLSPEEKRILKIRFSYPEKYWKLANYYYMHNKAWISGKNVEKLRILVEQKEAWRNFIKSCDRVLE